MNPLALLRIGGPAILGLLLVLQTANMHHWHKTAEGNFALYQAEKAAHAQTVTNYRAAAAAATKADADNKARVEAAQNNVAKEVSSDYEAKLAALRARYADALRVRPGAAPAHPSGPGSAPVPAASPAAGGLDASPATVDEFACRANTLQLDSLQQWVRQQLAVPR